MVIGPIFDVLAVGIEGADTAGIWLGLEPTGVALASTSCPKACEQVIRVSNALAVNKAFMEST